MTGVPLIQGGQEQQEVAQKLLTSVILCGVLIIAAQPLVMWLTGYDTVTLDVTNEEGEEVTKTYWTDEGGALRDAHDALSEDYPAYDHSDLLDHAMPPGVTPIFGKLIMGIRGIAAFFMVIAMIWGGIKLEGKPPSLSGHRGC